MKRKIGLMILLISTIALLTACGGNSSTAEATPTSGTITVYTALEHELVDEFLADFNAQYPDITVNIVRDSTGVITARLIAEAENPQADLVWGTAASSMIILDEMGLLEPYAPDGVERILPMFKSDAAVPTWVGITAWETAFIVNIPELERLGLGIDDIQCYDDLLRPELAGHIIMPHPASSGTGFLTVAGLLQLRGETGGWDFFEQLHANMDRYVHSGSQPARMAASGETVIGISFGYAGTREVLRGAPVEVILPAAGSGWDMEANALIRRDEIHPAALTFLNWAISESAFALYAPHYDIIATGGGNVAQLIENDFGWTARSRDVILDTWTERFGAGQ